MELSRRSRVTVAAVALLASVSIVFGLLVLHIVSRGCPFQTVAFQWVSPSKAQDNQQPQPFSAQIPVADTQNNAFLSSTAELVLEWRGLDLKSAGQHQNWEAAKPSVVQPKDFGQQKTSNPAASLAEVFALVDQLAARATRFEMRARTQGGRMVASRQLQLPEQELQKPLSQTLEPEEEGFLWASSLQREVSPSEPSILALLDSARERFFKALLPDLDRSSVLGAEVPIEVDPSWALQGRKMWPGGHLRKLAGHFRQLPSIPVEDVPESALSGHGKDNEPKAEMKKEDIAEALEVLTYENSMSSGSGLENPLGLGLIPNVDSKTVSKTQKPSQNNLLEGENMALAMHIFDSTVAVK